MPNKKILIVEDDAFLRQQIAFSLSKDFEIFQAGDRHEGKRLLEAEKPELVLADLRLPPSGKVEEGMRLLSDIRREQPGTIVIVMSAEEDFGATLRAIDAGAYDFFRKPFELQELKLIIHRAIDKKEIQRENERLRSELREKYSFHNIIGKSPAMARIYDSIRRVCNSPTTVILRGESGTGKEVIAHAIHYNGFRAAGPFVDVNCAALPETLVESELFGHEKGAFTGAVTTHTGKFEQANGGTLFLDEIGSISSNVQAKLLRALEEHKFQKVGGTRVIHSDVRLITATNEDLESKVKQGSFREDLYYRIQVFPIHVPSLRERREDIPLLVDYFLRKYCWQNQTAPKRVDARLMDLLMQHPWKGNVRELENVVQTLILVNDGDVILPHHLPSQILQTSVATNAPIELPGQGVSLDESVEIYERELIRSALKKVGGVKARAAKLLQIDSNRMKYLCRKHNL